ncbi:hypothetical protein OGM63_16845 [Plectonema radiosum NIES-515]|uniref:Holin n=1 Tax=Plectonema radiosum NIES-515 TaxID=2986073 RepID=A0ABT3B1B3_9CYAN|nr:hypothetical protein [Plectonema radiosum]MCV3215158.1 hypothetical protein [Plectonema radiosum NIES-515]
MKSLTPETIRAMTPIFIATLGAIIGIAALFSPGINEHKVSAGLSLAGTAIAGAAGLAQSSKNEPDFSVKQEGDSLQVKTPASEPSEPSDRD